MFAKRISLLALAGTAIAQSQPLNVTLAGNPELSNLTTFAAAIPGLLDTLGGLQNITLLAPSNQAFAELLTSDAGRALGSNPGALSAVLTYHVLNGSYPASSLSSVPAFAPTLLTNTSFSNVTGGQVVDGVVAGNQTLFISGLLQNSTVRQADIQFSGGYIHVIDKVLTVPASVADTATTLGLTSLAGALQAAGLVATVNETPDVTIFAPSNAAFAAISSVAANLSTTELGGILGYHVVKGAVGYSTELTNGQSLTTLAGGNVTVTISNGNVFVNGAKVITPNVLVANGVVHVIENVLIPNATHSGNTTSPSTPVSTGAAMPKVTNSVGYAALLGAGVAMAFL